MDYNYKQLFAVTFLLLHLATQSGETAAEELTPKSVIKTIQGEHGQIFDCVDINLQPSLEHPLLKNHTIQSDKGRSCRNFECPGFVQVSRHVTPGAILMPVINGTQREISFQVFQDAKQRVWWLTYGQDHNKQVGYWPGTLFSYMSDSASQIGWGGVVNAAPGESFPPMGSGAWPQDGQGKAAFFAGVEVVIENTSKERVFVAPNGPDYFNNVDDPKCYQVGPLLNSRGAAGWFFGGPGCPAV